MRYAVAIAFLSCSLAMVPAAAVSAQTIMVYVDASTDGAAAATAEKDVSEQVELLRASLEDGIMGEFFSAGVIVFSVEPPTAGAPQAVQLPGASAVAEMQSLYELQNAARDGGADHLVKVSLNIQIDQSGTHAAAVSARYDVYALSPRSIVTSGKTQANQFRGQKENAEDAIARRMGAAIATNVLSDSTQS